MPRKAHHLRPTLTVEDGDWVTVEWKDQWEECCNCGAIHSIDYQVVGGKLQFRARAVRRGT